MDIAIRIDSERLLKFATAVYVAAGMTELEAKLCADTLVQADLWGHQSHGVMRLSWYAARLKAGVRSEGQARARRRRRRPRRDRWSRRHGPDARRKRRGRGGSAREGARHRRGRGA